MTKDKEKTTLQTVLCNFIGELKVLAEAYPESDFDEFLIEEVAPALTEDDQLFSTSVFSKLEVAVILSQSELENKSYSLEGAMHLMNDDAICWLLDHAYTCDKAINVLRSFKKGYEVEPKDLRYAYNSLSADNNQLQKWLNEDLYERIQAYRNEIKKLREDK